MLIFTCLPVNLPRHSTTNVQMFPRLISGWLINVFVSVHVGRLTPDVFAIYRVMSQKVWLTRCFISQTCIQTAFVPCRRRAVHTCNLDWHMKSIRPAHKPIWLFTSASYPRMLWGAQLINRDMRLDCGAADCKQPNYSRESHFGRVLNWWFC